mgnify:CR=1 FL=1
MLVQESPYLRPVKDKCMPLLESSAGTYQGTRSIRISYGDTSCLPIGGIIHSGFEFIFSTLGQISHCDIVSHITPYHQEMHLHASIWSKSMWKQAGQEDSQLEGSCSLFVRTMPEQAVYPEDRQSPATKNLHLPRTSQIPVPPRSSCSRGDPVSFSGSMRSQNQTCSGRSRRFRESSAMDSWASHPQ